MQFYDVRPYLTTLIIKMEKDNSSLSSQQNMGYTTLFTHRNEKGLH